VVITDPGIKVDHGYAPYDNGITKGVFVKVCTYILICAMYIVLKYWNIVYANKMRISKIFLHKYNVEVISIMYVGLLCMYVCVCVCMLYVCVRTYVHT